MKRIFALGASTIVVVAVVLSIAIVLVTRRASTDIEYTTCPASAPSACASRLAKAWGRDMSQLPSIGVPADLHYDRGFITKNDKPPAGFFVFRAGAATAPAELTVQVVPASKVPFDAAHRGGTLRHLPTGREYLDRSAGRRSGPFLEQVGGFEVAVSFDSRAGAASLRPEQLELLGSVAASR